MDHTGHEKYVHVSRWVKVDLTIAGCDGKDTRHIKVPGFWFLWPCILQREFRTCDDGYQKLDWSIPHGQQTHIIFYNYPEGRSGLKNDSITHN